MKKNNNLIKLNLKHIFAITFVVCVLFLSFYLFENCWLRLIESIVDLVVSIVTSVCTLFKIDQVFNVTVNDFSIFISKILVFDKIEDISSLFILFFNKFKSIDNFDLFLKSIDDSLFYLFTAIIVSLPFVLIFAIVLNVNSTKQTTEIKDSKALLLYKKYELKVLGPVIDFVKSVILLLKSKINKTILLIILIISSNIATVIVEFLAYYLFFTVNFDFSTIYIQVCKLFSDLILTKDCWYVLLSVLFVWFLKKRKAIALKRLQRHEMRNRGFINSLQLINLVDGRMGTGKTKMCVDMCLSTEAIFKNNAYNKILENEHKFEHFDWALFCRFLDKQIVDHNIYNFASCSRVLSETTYADFDYDALLYGETFDNGVVEERLSDVIIAYAKHYLVYTLDSSLIISNHAIRSDLISYTCGNLPVVDEDFFNRDVCSISDESSYSHILDFDMKRLGKKLNFSNKFSDALDFGVVQITEIGKERGNRLDTADMKRKSDETNQLNDLFNSDIKLDRHKATVEFFPYLKTFCDDQRAMSINADLRELFSIISIQSETDQKISLPLFWIEELFVPKILEKYNNFYNSWRFNRADNTTYFYLMQKVMNRLARYYLRVQMQYGYKVNKVTVDDEKNQFKYYMQNKKIYANRYSTDCYSAFFEYRSKNSDVGLNDVPTYETHKASIEELESQNSYFINEISKLNGRKKDEIDL